MKKAFLPFILAFSFFAALKANAQDWQWARSVDKSTGSEGVHCVTDLLGSVYGAGYCFNSFYIGHDTFTNFDGGAAYIVKYDSSGNFLWATTTHNGKAFVLGITTDIYNNVYILGGYDSSFQFGSFTLTSTHTPPRGYFIAKINSSGVVQWVKGIGNVVSYFNQQTTSIITDNTGNLYITCPFISNATIGSFSLINSDPSGSTCDFLVAKFDSSGNVIWAKAYGGKKYDLPMGVGIASSGNIYITGYFNSDTLPFGTTYLLDTSITVGYSGLFLTKLDNSGNPIWAKGAGGNCGGYFTGLIINSYEDVFITGSYNFGSITLGSFTLPQSSSNSYGFLAKYNTSGVVSWVKLMQGQFIIPWLPTLDPCGNVWLISNMGSGHLLTNDTIDGHILAPVVNNGDPNFIASWSNSGAYITAVAMASGSTDDPNGIASDRCGNIYVIADQENCDTMIIGSDTFKNTGEDMFIAKYKSNIGCNCRSELQTDPEQNKTLNLYPNPVQKELTISATDKVATVSITNLLGQIVHNCVYDKNEVQVDITYLPAGIYLLRVNGTEVRKFVKE